MNMTKRLLMNSGGADCIQGIPPRLRSKVHDFYAHYVPDKKAAEIDGMLMKRAGNPKSQDQMWDRMIAKYGPWPPAGGDEHGGKTPSRSKDGADSGDAVGSPVGSPPAGPSPSFRAGPPRSATMAPGKGPMQEKGMLQQAKSMRKPGKAAGDNQPPGSPNTPLTGGKPGKSPLHPARAGTTVSNVSQSPVSRPRRKGGAADRPLGRATPQQPQAGEATGEPSSPMKMSDRKDSTSI